MNAIDLLKKDHAAVEALFDELAGVGEGAGRRAVFGRLRHELEVHATIEEELFYPAAEKLGGGADLVKEARREHAEVKEMLAQISKIDPKGADFVRRVERLRDSVRHHVREEEGRLFPVVNQHLGRDRIDELGKRLDARKKELAKGRVTAEV